MKQFGPEDFVIDPTNVSEDPILQFRNWYDEYLKTSPIEPAAMFLATADKNAIPSGRVVLLKAYDERGFSFFTNYGSRKGKDLDGNPFASLTFYWTNPKSAEGRQVRVFGSVEKVSAKESDEYFQTRALDSKIGACVSKQGEVLKSRDDLINKMQQLRQKHLKGAEIPRPSNWGGFRVVPSRIEFWQGRENRLHDRVEYLLEGKTWKRQRLSP